MLSYIRLPIIIGIIALSGLAFFVTPFMWLASLAYLSLCLGILARRRNTHTHARLMCFGVLIDVSLVLTLQLQRDAIATAVAFTLVPLQQAHIVVSTIALILYFPVAYLGWRSWKDPNFTARLLHRKLGVTAFILRSLGFLLMFSMLK
jgi:hypothetical protein